jgi:hypothetical protein
LNLTFPSQTRYYPGVLCSYPSNPYTIPTDHCFWLERSIQAFLPRAVLLPQNREAWEQAVNQACCYKEANHCYHNHVSHIIATFGNCHHREITTETMYPRRRSQSWWAAAGRHRVMRTAPKPSQGRDPSSPSSGGRAQDASLGGKARLDTTPPEKAAGSNLSASTWHPQAVSNTATRPSSTSSARTRPANPPVGEAKTGNPPGISKLNQNLDSRDSGRMGSFQYGLNQSGWEDATGEVGSPGASQRRASTSQPAPNHASQARPAFSSKRSFSTMSRQDASYDGSAQNSQQTSHSPSPLPKISNPQSIQHAPSGRLYRQYWDRK